MHFTKEMLEKLVKEVIIQENVTATPPGMPNMPRVSSGNIGDLLQQLNNLLSMWTERDPDTLAGRYYRDLKVIVDAYQDESTSMDSGIPSSNIPMK